MKKMLSIVVCLLVVAGICCSFSVTAFAASTTEVNEVIDLGKKGSLELTFVNNTVAFENENVNVYKIADIDKDLQYSVVSKYSSIPADFTKFNTNDEYDALAQTVYSYIVDNKIAADASATTDNSGVVKFANLSAGMYLVSPVGQLKDHMVYDFNAFLVAVPGVENGAFNYDVKALPKSTKREQEKEEYKIVVTWDDLGNEDKRPESMDFNIYKDGELYDTVTLTEKDNWSYTWEYYNDGSVWTVAEKNLPVSYAVAIVRNANIFNVTNSYIAPAPTGDTAGNNFVWAVVVFAVAVVAGCVAFALRKKHVA